MPYIHGRRRKTRTHRPVTDEHLSSIPKSLVVRHGRLTPSAKKLVNDLRMLMAPWCASRIKESRNHKLNDYLKTAKLYGFSHLQMLSQTEVGMYLKVSRLPSGPTATFKVLSFSLGKDVRLFQKRPHADSSYFSVPPLVVLKGFNKNKALDKAEDIRKANQVDAAESKTGRGSTAQGNPLELLSTTLSGMFPPIDANSIKLSQCRRVVLYSFSSATETIEMRQFAIIKRPAGVTRGVKKLLKQSTSKVVNLGRSQDVSDFVSSGGAGYASDSEVDETAEFDLPVNTTSEAYAGTTNKIGINLVELGPRLSLELLKIEEEVCCGGVLYHKYIQKSSVEISDSQKKAPALKAKRREERRKYEKALADKAEKAERKSAKMKQDAKSKHVNPNTIPVGEDDAAYDDERESKKSQSGKFNPFSFKRKRNSGAVAGNQRDKTFRSHRPPTASKNRGKFGNKQNAAATMDKFRRHAVKK